MRRTARFCIIANKPVSTNATIKNNTDLLMVRGEMLAANFQAVSAARGYRSLGDKINSQRKHPYEISAVYAGHTEHSIGHTQRDFHQKQKKLERRRDKAIKKKAARHLIRVERSDE
jgi:hypothetical protein